MAKICLYGELGDKYGKEYHLSVNSAPEAIRALAILKPGFIDDLQKWDYQIFVGDPDSDDKEELDEDTLGLHTDRDIHIIPVVDGAKKGIGKIIASVVLITASFFMGGAFWPAVVFNLGLSIGLQGVSMLLAPQQEKSEQSNLFNNDPLAAQQGTPIPVLYGDVYFECYPITTSVTAGLQGMSVGLDGSGLNGGTYSGDDGSSLEGSLDGWNLYNQGQVQLP